MPEIGTATVQAKSNDNLYPSELNKRKYTFIHLTNIYSVSMFFITIPGT